MNEFYKTICKSILKTSKENDLNYIYNDLVRKFIMVIEEIKVDGWDRDEFLDMMVDMKQELQQEDENAKKR